MFVPSTVKHLWHNRALARCCIYQLLRKLTAGKYANMLKTFDAPSSYSASSIRPIRTGIQSSSLIAVSEPIQLTGQGWHSSTLLPRSQRERSGDGRAIGERPRNREQSGCLGSGGPPLPPSSFLPQIQCGRAPSKMQRTFIWTRTGWSTPTS
jgi:hypothetical protein